MNTTLKISEQAKALVAKFRSTVIGLSDVSSRTLALLAQEAITAATAAKQAECERLTQEIEQYRSLAEQVGATKAVSDRDEARATCEALRKELAEAKKDSARLDWIVEQGSDMFWGETEASDHVDFDQWVNEGGNDDAPAIKKAYRAMLDAAAAISQGKAGT